MCHLGLQLYGFGGCITSNEAKPLQKADVVINWSGCREPNVGKFSICINIKPAAVEDILKRSREHNVSLEHDGRSDETRVI